MTVTMTEACRDAVRAGLGCAPPGGIIAGTAGQDFQEDQA